MARKVDEMSRGQLEAMCFRLGLTRRDEYTVSELKELVKKEYRKKKERERR